MQHFSEHIKDYQESMLESHNLSAQITGIRDVLDEMEVEPDASIVKSLVKKLDRMGACLWKAAQGWMRAKDWSSNVKPDTQTEYWYGCSKFHNNTIVTNFYMQDEELQRLKESCQFGVMCASELKDAELAQDELEEEFKSLLEVCQDTSNFKDYKGKFKPATVVKHMLPAIRSKDGD